jgi:hypothetical protein
MTKAFFLSGGQLIMDLTYEITSPRSHRAFQVLLNWARPFDPG